MSRQRHLNRLIRHAVLEVATLVANGLMATSNNRAGGEIIEGALQRYESRLPTTDEYVLRAQSAMFKAHGGEGTLHRVADNLPDFIQRLRSADPPMTEELVHALTYLGTAEILARRPETALAAMAEAAEIGSRLLGEHHQASIQALSHWSNTLLLAGKPAEAESVAERGVVAAHAAYKRPHPMISGLERRLANAQSSTGKPRDAAVLLARVLEDERAVQGDGSVQVAQARFYLGRSLERSGKPREGAQQIEAAQEALTRLTPDDHRNHWVRRTNLANAYLSARLPAQAIRVLEDSDRSARAAGVNVEQSVVPHVSRCFALTQLGRFPEAVAEYKALGPLMTRATPSEKARADRGLALLARLEGRATDAVTAANSALAALEGKSSTGSERAAAHAELGLALLEAGDLRAADIALQTSRVEFSEGQVGPSPDVLDVEVGLARVALSQGKRIEAVALLDEVLEYWRQFNPTGVDAAVAEYWRASANGATPSAAALKTLHASPYPLHRNWIAAAGGKR